MKNIKKKIYYVRNIIISICLFPFFANKAKGKKIIIFGFGNNFYENNIRFVYEYYLKHYSEKYSIFAVFDKNSIGCKFISTNNILYRGTIRTYLYFMYAKAIVFDMSNSDVAPGLQKNWYRTKRIFITHGMEGLKNVDYIFKNKLITADLMFAASDFEKKIKNKNNNYPNIAITGYPRCDFYGNVDKKEKKIVFMLTWRNYLNKNTIRNSDYLKRIKDFIEDLNISKFLTEKNIKCYVKIHHEVLKYINLIANCENIITDQNFDFSNVLNESCLLITDYSSVAWDFIYNDKPVLFYQFDKNEYEDKTGALYTDVIEDQIGFLVNSNDDIYGVLRDLFDNEEIPSYSIPNKSRFFKYIDNSNTERVIKSIEEFIR